MKQVYFHHRSLISTVLRFFVFSVLVGHGWLSAEVITMNNGDRISGEITAQSSKKVWVKTPYAGTIYITRSEIKQIGVDVSDEKRLIVASSANHSAKRVAPPLSALDPALVAVGNRKAKKSAEPRKFTGSVNFSLKSENGNTDKDELDADFSVEYREDKHRFRAQGQIEYDLRDGENNKQDWQIAPTYDHFISDQLYASVMYSAKQEKFSGLDLRQAMGPSLGYQFFDGKPVRLMSALGVYYVDEDFTNQDDISYFGPGWHLDYQHDLFSGKLQFYHRHYGVMNAEAVEKLLWHSWTGLKVPIIYGVVGSAEFEVDYDSQPGARAERVDTTLRFKLGYEW